MIIYKYRMWSKGWITRRWWWWKWAQSQAWRALLRSARRRGLLGQPGWPRCRGRCRPVWLSQWCSGCLSTEAILLGDGVGCGWAIEGGEHRQARPAGRVLRSRVRVRCAWTLLCTCQTWEFKLFLRRNSFREPSCSFWSWHSLKNLASHWIARPWFNNNDRNH